MSDITGFRGERLISTGDSKDLYVIRIRIGEHDQLPTATIVPVVNFNHNSLDMRFDVLRNGESFSVRVSNKGTAQKTFAMSVVGYYYP